ncbi:DUF4817 domain-containing protein [Trichonephila clavata]|uniref:DUF4817 domain-containing protein n=1 Tax=Trichonephila clavata TaxID=2740835 RepID=A0A8X6LZR5_TRICU|nr:DUF4817 domain-containing protein [Trichonephila clavata]
MNSPLEALLNKMSSMQEKAYCVFEYAKTSSVTVVQRHFRTKFRKEPPHRHNISMWVKQFQDTGCFCKNKSPGRKETRPEVVERIRDSLLRSSSKSTRRAGAERQEAVLDFILQQDGASPHWNKNVCELLKERLLHRWIGHAGPQDLSCLH